MKHYKRKLFMVKKNIYFNKYELLSLNSSE